MATDANEISGALPFESEPETVVSSEKSRGSFDIRRKRSGSGPNKTIYAVIALIVVVFFAIVIGIWVLAIGEMSEGTKQVDETKVKADATLQVEKASDDSMAEAKAQKIKQMQEQEEKERREREQREREAQNPDSKGGQLGATSNSANAANDGRSGSQTSQSGNPAPLTPEQRKLQGGVVIAPLLQSAAASGATVAGGSHEDVNRSEYRQSGQNSNSPSLNDAQLDLAGGGGLGGGSASRNRGSLSNLSGTGFAPGKAVFAPSRKYLLAHGTYARCALYTEIVTDQPGLIDCRLTEPLYSADGSTVLADAGDRLTGEQSVEVKAGQVNVFTSWTEIDTQAGVRARLDSLGAGPMGASGTQAWIDNHYKERFGGAVVLSFIQDALQAAANTTQKTSGSGGYTVNNSEQNVESMASKVLDNTINIAPTAHISPGTVLTIIVARDIDFSSVFENR